MNVYLKAALFANAGGEITSADYIHSDWYSTRLRYGAVRKQKFTLYCNYEFAITLLCTTIRGSVIVFSCPSGILSWSSFVIHGGNPNSKQQERETNTRDREKERDNGRFEFV